MNELIRLIQAPIIEEKLRALKTEIEQRTSDALALVCTEDTVKSVKATRAELNKEFQALEEQRKAVKKAVLDPYNQFEAIYKECVSDAYKRADAELKSRIDGVQQELRQRKEQEVADFFAEYAASRDVSWLNFCIAGPNVTLSASAKSLKLQAAAIIDRVASEVAAISSMDNSEEIMVEYKRTMNVAAAVSTVQERHRLLEQEKEVREAWEASKAQQVEAVKRVEAFTPPTVREEPEVLSLTFTVTDTRDRLRLLKQFLVSNGYTFTS